LRMQIRDKTYVREFRHAQDEHPNDEPTQPMMEDDPPS
jgi:hypothetical protein